MKNTSVTLRFFVSLIMVLGSGFSLVSNAKPMDRVIDQCLQASAVEHFACLQRRRQQSRGEPLPRRVSTLHCAVWQVRIGFYRAVLVTANRRNKILFQSRHL